MTDINMATHNDKLLEAIKNFKQNASTTSQNLMVSEIMQARFISPAIITPKPDKTGENVILKEKTTIQFNLIQNNRNENFFLAFSDLDELKKWQKSENSADIQSVVLNFDDYASMIMSEKTTAKGFVINPFSENIVMTKEIISAIKKNNQSAIKEEILEKETVVRLRKIKNPPVNMIQTISDYAKSDERINSMYIKDMIKDGIESYLLIIDYTGEKMDIFRKIADISSKELKGKALNIVDCGTSFAKEAISDISAFYQKK